MIEKILKVLRQIEEERRGLAVPQEEEARRIAELFEIKPQPRKIFGKKKKK